MKGGGGGETHFDGHPSAVECKGKETPLSLQALVANSKLQGSKRHHFIHTPASLALTSACWHYPNTKRNCITKTHKACTGIPW